MEARVRPARALWILCALFAASAYSDQRESWVDPSPHKEWFVTVAKDVRLEVLDWGGNGRVIVLLPGGGDTAHVYDDFAPKLSTEFHVYGITRRGFGASGFSESDYGADRLGDDVIAVLDALHLQKPVLVGHSIGGQELSSVGSRYPNRVAGLVYLEAGYSYAYDDGTVPSVNEFLQLGWPQPPPPGDSDLASFSALQKYYLRGLGFTYAEGELRQRWTTRANGKVGEERNFPGGSTLLAGMKKYTSIPVPVLAIFAIPHDQGKWVETSADAKVREAAKAVTAAEVAMTKRQADAFQRGVPTAHVVRLRAHHYVYLSNESDVLREMRSFMQQLK
jgi:non-heme chloroperoxidase